jgi:hypothetical protein
VTQEIDEYTGKPYDVDVGYVLAARKLWKKYTSTNGSSERAFIATIAPVLASLSGPKCCPHSTPGLDVCRFMFEAEERGDYKVIRSATRDVT